MSTLWDHEQAIVARDEAMARVESHSAPWRSFADRALIKVASRQSVVSSDDVWDELDRMGIPRPVEGRAMGPCMSAAVRKGYLRPLGYRQGRDPRHHLDVARTYESQLV